MLIEEILAKLNVFLFDKRWKIVRKNWKNVSNIIKKEFDSKAIYNEKYLKIKIKFYNGKISTNVHINEIPKEDPSVFVYQ